MKKDTSSNSQDAAHKEGQGNNIPAAGKQGKKNNSSAMGDMLRESEEQKGGRNKSNPGQTGERKNSSGK